MSYVGALEIAAPVYARPLNPGFPHPSTMKNITNLFLSVALSFLAVSVRADTLVLKNGTTLEGKYLGGTAETVRFETAAGMQIIEYSQIKNMNVTSAAAAAPAPAPAPAKAAPVQVTIPAGTVLLVRVMDSVSSQSSAGATFSTKLEYDLVANDVVVARAGTVVYGKVQSATQARRGTGKSTLDLRLTQMSINGTQVPIVSSSFAQAGEASGRKVARAAAAGAIIGNNTGNGSSSDGAAIGAGVAMLKPGQTLTIAPGTLLEFSITQPISLQLGR
jgi:hypothetical protein